MTTHDGPLLSISDLRLSYRTRFGSVEAVRGVTFDIAAGERVALVGESGSGKSTIASSIVGLTPRTLRAESGSIRFDGLDLLGARDRALNSVRGQRIGFVPQDPTVSLNPVQRVGEQVAEVLRVHHLAKRDQTRDLVIQALRDAGVDRPELRASQYPHELSGGLRQRVLIAIAVVAHPALLIADEPTSALDVTVQRRILDHLDQLTVDLGLSVLFITHDLGVAADRADRVLVLSRGEVVEQGTPEHVLRFPAHPYTRQLIADAPSLQAVRRVDVPAAHRTTNAGGDSSVPTLELRHIVKDYELPRSAGGGTLRAVDDVSLAIPAGSTFGLVGESGSGKTTTGKIALRLERQSSGTILFQGDDISDAHGEALRRLRTRIQVVQQNPYATLNPSMTVGRIISEPLASFGIGSRSERRGRALDLLEQVALPRDMYDRGPSELSGGQRQRVAIARALSIDPALIILDEPVSALDVSVQAQILDLLVELQEARGLSYLFISHDLAVVRDIAHDVGVIERGRIVETGPTLQIFEHPCHPYTRELLDAIPGTLLHTAESH